MRLADPHALLTGNKIGIQTLPESVTPSQDKTERTDSIHISETAPPKSKCEPGPASLWLNSQLDPAGTNWGHLHS